MRGGAARAALAYRKARARSVPDRHRVWYKPARRHMGTFRTSRSGGNVVHRIEFGGGGQRRARPRRRSLERLAGGLPSGAGAPVRGGSDVIPAAPPRPMGRMRADAEALDRPRASGVAQPAAAEPRHAEPAAAAASTQDVGARRQIDLLERRLAKMTRLLEEKEQEVAITAARPSESGVASVFREVQGLDGSGEEVERKKALMSRIFEANLDLRKQIISG